MRTGVWMGRGTRENSVTGSPRKVAPSGNRVVPAAVGEPLVGGGGLEDLHLLLEYLAVAGSSALLL
jgi:hypothetical protein